MYQRESWYNSYHCERIAKAKVKQKPPQSQYLNEGNEKALKENSTEKLSCNKGGK